MIGDRRAPTSLMADQGSKLIRPRKKTKTDIRGKAQRGAGGTGRVSSQWGGGWMRGRVHVTASAIIQGRQAHHQT